MCEPAKWRLKTHQNCFSGSKDGYSIISCCSNSCNGMIYRVLSHCMYNEGRRFQFFLTWETRKPMVATSILTKVSTLVSGQRFRRFAALRTGTLLQKLRKDHRCGGCIHVLQVLVVQRHFHKHLDDINHWYNDICTPQVGFDNLFDYWPRLYETANWIFSKRDLVRNRQFL